MKFSKIMIYIFSAAAAFFVVTFTIYFFTLDMKAAEKIMPVFAKHYEHVKKEKRL